jgi:hypothetical protein
MSVLDLNQKVYLQVLTGRILGKYILRDLNDSLVNNTSKINLLTKSDVNILAPIPIINVFITILLKILKFRKLLY